MKHFLRKLIVPVSFPSPDLTPGLTGQPGIPGRCLLDRQSKSDASDFDHLVSAEVEQARLRVNPRIKSGEGDDTHFDAINLGRIRRRCGVRMAGPVDQGGGLTGSVMTAAIES